MQLVIKLNHARYCRMHPYLVQEDLKVYCDAKGIRLVAYTATGMPGSDDCH